MFSPYYAAARRRGPADPLAHVAVNVALHGPHGHRWAMTERSQRALARSREQLAIGRSRLAWRNGALEIEVHETCAPWPRALRGRITLQPMAELGRTAYALDTAGRHRWCPLAPAARVQVAFDAPGAHWQGTAYLDANAGSRPLEDDFIGWHWQRDSLGAGACRIHYDVERRDGTPLALALHTGHDGQLVPCETAPRVALARTGWGLARQARGDRVLRRTLEDGPFYARSELRGPGGAGTVHESLSLDRFSRRWVQALLPFKMPRRG